MQQNNFLYTCEECQVRGHEQFIAEHSLGFIVSGETQFHTSDGVLIYGAGTIGLVRKNILAKTMKLPSPDGTPFKSINLTNSLQHWPSSKPKKPLNYY